MASFNEMPFAPWNHEPNCASYSHSSSSQSKKVHGEPSPMKDRSWCMRICLPMRNTRSKLIKNSRHRQSSLLLALRFHLLCQPGAAVTPPPAGCGNRNAEHLSGFLQGEADEIPEFDESSLILVERLQPFQCFTQGQPLLVRQGCGNLHLVNGERRFTAAMSAGAFAAGAVN